MPVEVIDKIKPKNSGDFPVADAEDIQVNGNKRLPDFILPIIGEEDEGKILKVVDGRWSASTLPTYNGNTVITPNKSTQTLETAGKMVETNISVNPIEYAEVGNTAGGKTVTIGG